MSPDTRRRLLLAFKNHRPLTVRARLADEETRDLAQGRTKAKWLPIIEALDTLPWVSVHLLDAKGRQLGAQIDNDGAATELENISGATVSSRTQEVAQLQQLVQKGTNANLQWYTETLKPVLDAQTRTVTLLQQTAEHYRDLAEKADRRANRAESERDDLASKVGRLVETKEKGDEKGWTTTVGEVAQVMPQILQLTRLGLHGLSLLGSGRKAAAAAPSTSGANGTGATKPPASGAS